EPFALAGVQQVTRHFEPQRHRLDDPVALELEVDVRELLIHAHTDRHAPGEQRRERRPGLGQQGSELHVPRGDPELVARAEQVRGGVYDRGDLVTVVGDHRDLHWTWTPPVPGGA